MYPELEKAGGLSNALNLEFERINSTLRVTVDENFDKIPVTYARVENGNKFSQIYIAAEEKLYLPDFWREGVCLAHANTDSISELAKVVDYWLRQDVSTQVLSEKFSFVQSNGKAKAFDENKEVEYTWNCLLQDDSLGLNEFVELASKDEILNKLFPFTSLYTLCFSRCTGFPFDTTDLPNVTPVEYIHFALPKNTTEYAKIIHDSTFTQTSKIYVVTKNKSQYIGEGDANEALNIVRDILPDNIEPAVKGVKRD